MPADYYDDGPTSGGTMESRPDGENASPQVKEKGEGDQKTFLLNKDIDPSFKVGEEMVVKIVGVTEKEYEVIYAPPEKDEGKGEEGEGETPMAPAAGGGDEGGGGQMASLYS